MLKLYKSALILLCYLPSLSLLATALPSHQKIRQSGGISSNPAAVNLVTGTGMLQKYIEKKLGIKNNQGFRWSGAYIADTNDLFSGGVPKAKHWTSNSLFLLSTSLDLERFSAWPGGLINAEFLQFNGQLTNLYAGSIQGYNGLPGPPPLNRSELYQLWLRQSLFEDRFIIRIGKQVPMLDFNNVIKPLALNNDKSFIPAVTGLLYTPIFVNASMLGVLPGYYNSATGITINIAPIKTWYLSLGRYDGNLARNVQIGLTGPHFNGSYFDIAETGVAWLLGRDSMPGNLSVGAWHQSGPIMNLLPSVVEQGASGGYLFGSQRIWYRHPGEDNSGISIFYQYGKNDAFALPVKQYAGGGLTLFGLIDHRENDSIGAGLAYSWLNPKKFIRNTEAIWQAYYQAQLCKGAFLEPALSYIPNPGMSLKPAWAGTLRGIFLL